MTNPKGISAAATADPLASKSPISKEHSSRALGFGALSASTRYTSPKRILPYQVGGGHDVNGYAGIPNLRIPGSLKPIINTLKILDKFALIFYD
jgi:hypothetical protein